MSDLAQEFRSAVARAVDQSVYGSTHDATVRVQHEDGTVDLEVDSPEIVQITDVPLRVGISTARVVVDEGARVRLAFEGGDPAKPFAFGIDMDPSADRGIARMDDSTDDGEIRFVTTSAPTALSVQHFLGGTPTGVPMVITLGVPATVVLSLSGKISSASDKAFLT